MILLALLLLALGMASGAPELQSAPAPAGPGLAGELRFSRTGGFAGVDERLRITPDGRVRVTVRGREPVRFRLSAAERAGLARNLRDARFAAIPTDSMGEGTVADGFQDVIVYAGHTVRTQTGSRPVRLDPVVRRLGHLLERGGATATP